ncbi:MAG: hypothetical protein IJT26_05245 [Bacteroidales bacterium]|nr:hypothetical protein [Bacteroidales bacterium]
MAKNKGIGIKRRVLLGCVVLGLILFFSSIISLYEMRSTNKFVSDVIADNVRGIDAAKELLNIAEENNLSLMAGIDKDFSTVDSVRVEDFGTRFNELRSSFMTASERRAADSVMYSYAAYMQVVGEAEKVWEFDEFIRREWFFDRLQPVYLKFRGYLSQLTNESEKTLIRNSQNLQENYHRSAMPSFISMILTLVLVVLFNYYLNYYVINPLLKVNRDIKAYRQFGRKYDVKLDSGDEIAELNSNIKDLVDLNQSYKKQLQKQ